MLSIFARFVINVYVFVCVFAVDFFYVNVNRRHTRRTYRSNRIRGSMKEEKKKRLRDNTLLIQLDGKRKYMYLYELL